MTHREDIVEAEGAFARRKFSKALKLANRVLLQCGPTGEPTGEPTNACGNKSTSSGGSGSQKERACSTEETRHGGAKRVDSSTAPQKHERNGVICMRTPLTLIGCNHQAKDEGLYRNSTGRNAWHVSVTTTKVSVPDRAAAVAIQSSYEIFQGQSSRSRDQRGVERGGSPNDAKRIERISKNIGPFIDMYRADSDDDESSSYTAMPLELAAVWIKFCHAVGCSGIAVSAAVELLVSIIQRDDLMEDALRLEGGVMMEHCEDLLYFLLIDVLPRVKDTGKIRAVLSQLSNLQTKATTAETEWSRDATLNLYPEANSESLAAIFANLDTRRSALDPSFSDILEECVDKLHELVAIAKMADQNVTSASSRQMVAHVAESVSNRSASQGSNALLKEEDGEEQVPPPLSVAEHIRNNIIEPLWDSEDRWANRARVAAVGVTAYMVWRRRRRVAAATRSAGYAVLSPFREIVDAVASLSCSS